MGVVLVVEDDTSSRLIICSIVKKMGHLPIQARNGRIAWEFLKDNTDIVGLVITDLMMPEMDGSALISKIRSQPKIARLPIIVQSAYIGVKGFHALLEEGADAIVPKPIDAQYLMDHIERHLPRANP